MMMPSTRRRIESLEQRLDREIGYRDRSLDELRGIAIDLAALHGKKLVYSPVDPAPPRRWRLEEAKG